MDEAFCWANAAGLYTVAIRRDGSLWAWGHNNRGQLGDGTRQYRATPVRIMGSVVAVSATREHTAAILADSSLWLWGDNRYGKLGDGRRTTYDGDDRILEDCNRRTPTYAMDDVMAVSAGHYHTMAIRSDSSLWGWGYNKYGQLGDGTRVDKVTPLRIMENVRSVSAGKFNTMAIKADNSLWAWGFNTYGHLGDGTTGHKPVLQVRARWIPSKLLDQM